MNITMLRKALTAIALAAGLSVAASGAANASGLSGLDFRLDNYKYDATIESLEMSVHGADDYTKLKIGGPVEPRSFHRVLFTGEADSCYYDLVGYLSNGNTVTWTNVDLCHTTDLTVH
jgi:hypothetical protein